MAKNYLIHYGVKKSQWSPQARARYDARHRPKAISEESNTSGSFGPAQSEAYKQLTPKEREQARKLSEFTKRARKQYKYFGKFIPKYIAKKIDKYSTDGDRQNKYAEEILKNRKFKTGTAGQSVGSANIIKRQPARSKSAIGNRQNVPLARPTSSSGGKGKPTSGSKHIGNGVAQQPQSTSASLPKAGFIFKRPQARTVGKDLYKATKKEAHKVKKQNDAAKKEAQDAFERHKKEAERSYAKQQEAKAKKKAAEKKRKEKEDKKAVDAYNRNLERNARNYKRQKYEVEDFFGRKKTKTYKDMKESKNPFDRISVDYKPIKTSDNKLVRFAKKAYNELGFNYNSTPEQEREGHKRWKENEKRKRELRKEYEKQKKAREKEYEKQQKARQKVNRR